MKLRMLVMPLLWAAGLALPPTASADWSRSWAIEWYEPAMYFGGKPGDQIAPGTDCPDGIRDVDWVKVMVDAGYTKEEARWIRDPANPTRSPLFGQPQMAFRGKDRANVYIHPETTPESGELRPVASKIAEGLDLDGNKTNGFVSPAGERGIDNNFYKAVGCWKTYRGAPRLGTNAQNVMDGMRGGGWTVVIVASGKGSDPMNDTDAQLGFYASPDKLVKTGEGGIARDYTFRIKPDSHGEGVFKAKVVNGKIITDSLPEMWIHEPDKGGQLQLLRARASLEMLPDGSLKGYLGGYRPWVPLYNAWLSYIAPSMESLTWVRLPDVAYAFKRYSDYSPTGPGGEKTHISYAIRIDAVPAFVITPDAKEDLLQVASFSARTPGAPPNRVSDATGGGGSLGGGARSMTAPDGTPWQFRDGIMFPKGQGGISQTAEQLRPPATP